VKNVLKINENKIKNKNKKYLYEDGQGNQQVFEQRIHLIKEMDQIDELQVFQYFFLLLLLVLHSIGFHLKEKKKKRKRGKVKFG